MKDKKKQLLETLEKSNKAGINGLYARARKGKGVHPKRQGIDPIDDVLDPDFKPDADPVKVAPTRTGVMNKNNELEAHKDKKNKYKLKAFLEKRKNKKKAK
jgi:hypothetical protein